jgi:hypothetical protein
MHSVHKVRALPWKEFHAALMLRIVGQLLHGQLLHAGGTVVTCLYDSYLATPLELGQLLRGAYNYNNTAPRLLTIR